MPLKYNSITKEFFIMKKTNNVKVNNAKATAEQAKVTKSFKTKTETVQAEVTNIQLYDDIAVAIESKTLAKMEHWAYKVQEELEEMLCFDDERYTEDELNEMIVDAGLMLNLFEDKANEYGYNTYKICKSIIRMCIHGIDKIEDRKTKKPGRISVVKTMSEGLKYTETDDWDDF